MDDDKNIRIHAGVQYANLGSELWVINSVSTRDGVNLLPPQSFSGSPSYNGFGPRFGSDFSVNNFLPVRIYANLAGAILAGTSHHNKQFNYPEYGTANSGNGANMHVVPELDAKLGGTYQYQTPNGQLVLDAGWMFVNYWNALVTISPSDLSTVFTTNIAFQGPYVGLKWIGG